MKVKEAKVITLKEYANVKGKVLHNNFNMIVNWYYESSPIYFNLNLNSVEDRGKIPEKFMQSVLTNKYWIGNFQFNRIINFSMFQYFKVSYKWIRRE